MSKYLTTSLLIVGVLAGVGAGYFISPQYSVMNDRSSQMVDLGRADRYFDQRYMEAMISHHRGAILLAEQAKAKTKRPEIKALAESILDGEPKLIDELYKWRKDWYNNSSKVDDKPTVNLGDYDENFDLRFMNAVIAHHEAGVEMANEAATKSTRNEVITNALAVSDFLSRSANTLEDWRFTWYGIRPSGSMAYADNMNDMLGRADKEVDLRYINQMISHHRGAMLLAEQIKDKTQRKEIKELAEAIIAGEPKNIDELYKFKKDLYNDETRVPDPKVTNLGTFDDKMDLRFLNALIAHHQDGLMMNKEIHVKSSRNEILNSVDATDDFFNKTLAIFKEWRTQWYGLK